MGDIFKIPVSKDGRDSEDAGVGALLRLDAELDASIVRVRLLFMGLATLTVPLALLVFLGRRDEASAVVLSLWAVTTLGTLFGLVRAARLRARLDVIAGRMGAERLDVGR